MARRLTPFDLQSAVQEGTSWRKIGLKEEGATYPNSEKRLTVEPIVGTGGRDEKCLHNFSPGKLKNYFRDIYVKLRCFKENVAIKKLSIKHQDSLLFYRAFW
jgi:hypothetical protein